MRRILFVCTGNICRSPVAEGIARARARERGLDLHFDSAGTHDYHVGEAPDPRARAVAREAGTPVDDLRARRVAATDFGDFDLILAADRGHLRQLERWRPSKARAETALLLPWCGIDQPDEVPDPYYGSLEGFNEVQALLERAIDGLLLRLG
ncbi:MAG: low molecular weight protein-tyrosine-phosphatase [Lysobacterales bacterium]